MRFLTGDSRLGLKETRWKEGCSIMPKIIFTFILVHIEVNITFVLTLAYSSSVAQF